MKKTAVVSAVILLAVLSGCSKGDRFVSQSGGFSITAPARMEKTVRPVETPYGRMAMNLYLLRHNRFRYMIAYLDYPASLLKSKGVTNLLENGASHALRRMGGKGSVNKRTFQGVAARGFSAVIGEQPRAQKVRGLLFFHNRRMFQLMMISPPGKELMERFRRFSGSFQLLDR